MNIKWNLSGDQKVGAEPCAANHKSFGYTSWTQGLEYSFYNQSPLGKRS